MPFQVFDRVYLQKKIFKYKILYVNNVCRICRIKIMCLQKLSKYFYADLFFK